MIFGSVISSGIKAALSKASNSSSSKSNSKSKSSSGSGSSSGGSKTTTSYSDPLNLLGGGPLLGGPIGASLAAGLSAYSNYQNSKQQEQLLNQYLQQYPQYQPIDNSALYEQQARERAAQIRAAIDRQRTAAQGNISSIENQYGTAIGDIEAQRSKLPGEFQTLANQASNRGQVNAQRIRNAMTQMGLGQSGESASQQLQQNLATSQQLNDLNLNRQNIEADMGRQVSTLQGEQAAKIAQINQAIADAEAAGDEQAALALEEARARIASEASQNAAAQNEWNLQMTDRIRAAQQAAEQDAWNRGGFDSAYDLWQSQQALQQAQQLGLVDYEYAKRGELAKLEAALRPASSGSGGSTGAPTATQTRNTYRDAYADINSMISQGTPLTQILDYIDRSASTLAMYGVDVNSLRSWAKKQATGNKSYTDNWQYAT